MRRVFRALRLFFGSRLTWRSCRRLAGDQHFRVVARDGFLYIEPK